MKQPSLRRICFGILLIAAMWSDTTVAATWDGEAATNVPPDRSWATAANWVEEEVPADNTAIVFDHRASGATNVLDASRTTPSLDFSYTTSGSSSHTVDLSGNVLTIGSWLDVGHERTATHVAASASAALRNGTLQFADGASLHVACGREFRLKSTGTLTLDSTAIWRAGSLADVLIGNSPTSDQTENVGSLNLSALTSPASLIWLNGTTEVPGTLNVGKLHVGYDLEDRYVGSGAFSIGTALTQLVVRTELFVGVASSATWSLPANVFYRLGDEQSGRVDLRLNVAAGNRDAAGIDLVWAPGGGGFRAYLSALQMGIGSSSDRAGGYWRSVLDLTNTTVSAFDVSGDVVLGGASAVTGTGHGQGTLRLPAISARIGGNLIVDKGGASADRFGLLELHGTQLAVEGTVTVNAKGTIRCVFSAQNQSGDWFLRVLGDHLDAWTAYMAGNQMTSTGTPANGKLGVWFRSGYTHLGLPPPAGTVIVIN